MEVQIESGTPGRWLCSKAWCKGVYVRKRTLHSLLLSKFTLFQQSPLTKTRSNPVSATQRAPVLSGCQNNGVIFLGPSPGSAQTRRWFRASAFLPATIWLILSIAHTAAADVIELAHYKGFRIWLDCERRGAVQFQYTVGPDTGDLPRKHSFSTPDEEIFEECQQKSSETYGAAPERFDRGHLVPANHLDHLEQGIEQSNYMTNVLPQRRNMNRGAWLLTEEIVECHREEQELTVVGGVVYGRNPHDDYFLESHGVATPDYYWKVVKTEDDVIAWYVPNSHEAKRGQLDKYLISIHELHGLVPRVYDDAISDISEDLRRFVPSTSWRKPRGCDLS